MGEDPGPEVEDGPPTPERASPVQRGRRTVLNVCGKQSEDDFEISTVEGVVGTVESGPEDAAANRLGKPRKSPCHECSQSGSAYLHSVGQGASALLRRRGYYVSCSFWAWAVLARHSLRPGVELWADPTPWVPCRCAGDTRRLGVGRVELDPQRR